MIEVINVTKRFDRFTALDQVTMHVKKGVIYGLVGPNGAGKSTIIRHITGAYRQDAGEIRVDGQIVYENAAAKANIAYIPDDIFYFNQSNLKDMVRFYKEMYASFDSDLFERLQDCFPSINRRRAIRRLSKGMQKQAAFWLAICCRPKLLILDEPVDGLDPVMRRQIWSLLMSDVAEHGTTVLVSSHNLRELEDVCDHVGIMHHGKIIMEKSLDDLQGGVSKVQLAFESEELPVLPDGMEILHRSKAGRVHTLIIRGEQSVIRAQIASLKPILFDILPLTLEEIFIYELGGAEYEVKDILI
ncbi:ABC transporter ATP-binding protein YtrB [Eubacterium plexicaudatum ASF492]|uniref:ABC transporter domain-containing protein n=1 Tax=Eubacterium plexicaudatum ASF492 TaxID=1235802 RepID=N2AM42_9FIRM|nr:ABC transporter ATP-binding protein YtrB [Eubacterium plexicaudatum ASF492]